MNGQSLTIFAVEKISVAIPLTKAIAQSGKGDVSFYTDEVYTLILAFCLLFITLASKKCFFVFSFFLRSLRLAGDRFSID